MLTTTYKVMSLNYLLSNQQSKTQQYSIYSDIKQRKKLQNCTFKKLDLENVWHFGKLD